MGEKYLLVVNAMDLELAHGHKTGFELLDGVVWAAFDLKDQFRFHNLALCRVSNQTPCIHAYKL